MIDFPTQFCESGPNFLATACPYSMESVVEVMRFYVYTIINIRSAYSHFLKFESNPTLTSLSSKFNGWLNERPT